MESVVIVRAFPWLFPLHPSSSTAHMGFTHGEALGTSSGHCCWESLSYKWFCEAREWPLWWCSQRVLKLAVGNLSPGQCVHSCSLPADGIPRWFSSAEALCNLERWEKSNLLSSMLWSWESQALTLTLHWKKHMLRWPLLAPNGAVLGKEWDTGKTVKWNWSFPLWWIYLDFSPIGVLEHLGSHKVILIVSVGQNWSLWGEWEVDPFVCSPVFIL